METISAYMPSFDELTKEIKKVTALAPKDAHNQTPRTIDDLLASIRYLTTGNNINHTPSTKENLTQQKAYPIEIDEKRGYIMIRSKDQAGYVAMIDSEEGILFNGHNHPSQETIEQYERTVYNFFTQMKNLYTNDKDISRIIHEWENIYATQHPASAIKEILTQKD